MRAGSGRLRAGAAERKVGNRVEDIGRLLSIACRNHELTSWRFSVW
jgi:hypothetical protein